ncbi:hypothetical protein [Streptomyces sp. NPDC090798]|uniref:hypothetical protein n=1 Tax=Streptomyces sp. NPDC090798 TaxID=3365968 RepID=UPI00382FECF3
MLRDRCGRAAAATNAGAATSDDEPVPADDAQGVLNDGTVAHVNDEIEFTFTGDKTAAKRPQVAAACPEVNDPPTYAEASIVVEKAKVKVDTKISNSWTWRGT